MGWELAGTPKLSLAPAFYGYGNESLERWGHLLKVTQLISCGAQTRNTCPSSQPTPLRQRHVTVPTAQKEVPAGGDEFCSVGSEAAQHPHQLWRGWQTASSLQSNGEVETGSGAGVPFLPFFARLKPKGASPLPWGTGRRQRKMTGQHQPFPAVSGFGPCKVRISNKLPCSQEPLASAGLLDL